MVNITSSLRYETVSTELRCTGWPGTCEPIPRTLATTVTRSQLHTTQSDSLGHTSAGMVVFCYWPFYHAVAGKRKPLPLAISSNEIMNIKYEMIKRTKMINIP